MGINIATVLGSAVDQAQKSSLNLQAISQAKVKQQREREIFDLTKKKAELGLKEAELRGGKTALELENMKYMSDVFKKNQEDILKGKDAMIDQTEQEQTDSLKKSSAIIKNIMPKIVGAGYAPVMGLDGKVALKPIKQEKPSYGGTSRKPYDELAVNSHAKKLTDIELRRQGIDPKMLSTEDAEQYGRLISANISRAEKTMYGKVISKQEEKKEVSNVNPFEAGLKYGQTGKVENKNRFKDGATAINGQTGERLVFKDGKWQKT